jgi:hypothetical protein
MNWRCLSVSGMGPESENAPHPARSARHGAPQKLLHRYTVSTLKDTLETACCQLLRAEGFLSGGQLVDLIRERDDHPGLHGPAGDRRLPRDGRPQELNVLMAARAVDLLPDDALDLQEEPSAARAMQFFVQDRHRRTPFGRPSDGGRNYARSAWMIMTSPVFPRCSFCAPYNVQNPCLTLRRLSLGTIPASWSASIAGFAPSRAFPSS